MKKNQHIISHLVTKRSGSVWVGNMVRSWCPEAQFTNYENVSPIDFCNVVKSGVVILQTRDLLNWYASYIFSKRKKTASANICLSWMAIASEFYIPVYLKDHKVVHVMYDDFFKSQDYRKDVCAQLDGVYSEEKLQVMGHGAGGSSFTKMEMDGRAQSMPVLERYRMVDPSLYVGLFNMYPSLLKFYKRRMMDDDKREFLISIGVM